MVVYYSHKLYQKSKEDPILAQMYYLLPAEYWNLSVVIQKFCKDYGS